MFNGHKKYLSVFFPRIHSFGIVSTLLSIIFFSAFTTENILNTFTDQSFVFSWLLSDETLYYLKKFSDIFDTSSLNPLFSGQLLHIYNGTSHCSNRNIPCRRNRHFFHSFGNCLIFFLSPSLLYCSKNTRSKNIELRWNIQLKENEWLMYIVLLWFEESILFNKR